MNLTEALESVDLTEEAESTLFWAITKLEDETKRRSALANAEQVIADAQEAWREAASRKPGDPWVQPTGAHDAYPKDWRAPHNNKNWVSLVDHNVHEPGVSGWREEASGDGGVPEYVQPSGQHDAYHKSDKVTFEGKVYESTIDNNVWSPAAYPQGWKEVTA